MNVAPVFAPHWKTFLSDFFCELLKNVNDY